MNLLIRDQKFLQYLPNLFNFGFFLMDISETKKIFLKNLDEYISKLKREIILKLENLLSENSEIFNKTVKKLKKNPITIEKYIKLKNFTSSKKLNQVIIKMNEYQKAINQLIECIEMFLIEFDPLTYQNFFQSNTWTTKLKNIVKKTVERLEEIRPRYKKILENDRENIKNNFFNLKEEIKEVDKCADINQAFDLVKIVRKIDRGLKILYDKAKTLNYHENFLKFRGTDFTGIIF